MGFKKQKSQECETQIKLQKEKGQKNDKVK